MVLRLGVPKKHRVGFKLYKKDGKSMISDAEEILEILNDLENDQQDISPKQAQLYDAVRSLCAKIKAGAPDRAQMAPTRPLY